jgi:hypothetical protein
MRARGNHELPQQVFTPQYRLGLILIALSCRRAAGADMKADNRKLAIFLSHLRPRKNLLNPVILSSPITAYLHGNHSITNTKWAGYNPRGACIIHLPDHLQMPPDVTLPGHTKE